jgi:hypothetical protein
MRHILSKRQQERNALKEAVAVHLRARVSVSVSAYLRPYETYALKEETGAAVYIYR